jgi:hypothetical protein
VTHNKDKKEDEQVSDTDLQEMIDEGQIFGSEDTDLSTNYEAYEMARQVAGAIRDCDCGRTDPHAHIVMKRPKGSNLTEAELQEMAQRHFDEALKKKLREKEQAEKRRKLFGGE